MSYESYSGGMLILYCILCILSSAIYKINPILDCVQFIWERIITICSSANMQTSSRLPICFLVLILHIYSMHKTSRFAAKWRKTKHHIGIYNSRHVSARSNYTQWQRNANKTFIQKWDGLGRELRGGAYCVLCFLINSLWRFAINPSFCLQIVIFIAFVYMNQGPMVPLPSHGPFSTTQWLFLFGLSPQGSEKVRVLLLLLLCCVSCETSPSQFQLAIAWDWDDVLAWWDFPSFQGEGDARLTGMKMTVNNKVTMGLMYYAPVYWPQPRVRE